MRTKLATVARLAVRPRPVCPCVNAGITARIIVPIATAISAWIAEATGTPASRSESPSSAVPITTQPYATCRMNSSGSAHVAPPAQRTSCYALTRAARTRIMPAGREAGSTAQTISPVNQPRQPGASLRSLAIAERKASSDRHPIPGFLRRKSVDKIERVPDLVGDPPHRRNLRGSVDRYRRFHFAGG
jgi:hypothetical protein